MSDKYLLSLQGKGIVMGLESMTDLVTRLGLRPPPLVVHVAGTNGKGSVTAVVASILSRCGVRTGAYYSPHVKTFREVIRVDHAEISELIFDAAVRRVSEHAGPSTTQFEALTCAAFLCFLEANADAWVVEVGLGGGLDATNIFPSATCVLTPIDMDHAGILGNHIEDIARAKVGIVKPTSRVAVTAPQRPDAMRVISSACELMGVTSHSVPAVDASSIQVTLEGTTFDHAGRRWATNLIGAHQATNCAVAIDAVRASVGAAVATDDNVARGLESVLWRGRFEVLLNRDDILVILDGAHNPHGFRSLVATAAAALQEGCPAVLVVGVMADKDVAAIAECLSQWHGLVAVVAFDTALPRGMHPETCVEILRGNLFCEICVAGSAQSAVRMGVDVARRQASRAGVFLAGSLYTQPSLREAVCKVLSVK